MSPTLAQLREELDALDTQLLDLAARRLELVRAVAEVKRLSGAPVFDRERERVVFDRAREKGESLGLPAGLAESLLRPLVAASHSAQDEHLRPDDDPHSPSILLVGGRGAMARRLALALNERGRTLQILDEGGDPAQRRAAAASADIVLLCVPMARVRAVAEELGPALRPDALLADINSLKAEICEVMARVTSAEVLGLHPMFGPSVRSLRRQKVVVCAVRPGPLGAWLCAELGALGLDLVSASPEEHDRAMAVVQVLTHFSTLTLGEALRGCGLTLRRSLDFTSPIYRLELAFVGRLFAQNPDLYAGIEMGNPQGAAVREAFVAAASRWAAVVASGDRVAFAQQFEAVRGWFQGFDAEAMRLSDEIIDTLTQRP